MNKILITGGAGFVGRHFTRHFLEAGDAVHCIDSVVPRTGGIDPEHKWPLFDPRDYSNFRFYRQDCRQFFESNRGMYFDYALHLAAIVGGREMIEWDPLAIAEDLSIDSAYWQWAKSAKPGKTVCFSSSAAYPIKYQSPSDYRLLTEDMIHFQSHDIGKPDLTYGWAKLTNEYLARLAHERYGLRSICYRPFSGYGEDQDDAYPFPSVCKRVLRNIGEPVITVWGSGNQMRDFIHISDCVRGVVSTMDKIDNGDALNLSTGIFTSFKEFAATASDIVGFRPQVEGMSAKPEGVFARAGDVQKQHNLGFVHSVDLAEGIRMALDHYERSAGFERLMSTTPQG